jgi:hypothetical protein
MRVLVAEQLTSTLPPLSQSQDESTNRLGLSMTTISSIQFAKHDFPLLASLSLDEDEWSAIRNNGYIIEDMRSARS